LRETTQFAAEYSEQNYYLSLQMDTHITMDDNAITGALPLCEAGDGNVFQDVLA
jgi:hypothetical protein